MIFDEVFTEVNINESMFYNIDVDNYLDQRDIPPFDTEWISAYESVKEVRSKLDNAELNNLNELREKVYKLVYQFSQHPELSGYISDDFEIICLNKFSDNKNSWILNIFDSYKKNSLPK